MKTLRTWIVSNPFTAVAGSGLLFTLVTCLAFRDDWLPWVGSIATVTLMLLTASMARQAKITALLLSLALATPVKAAEEQPQAAGVAVGLVVVCIGLFCGYKVVKFCNKKFPREPKTNEVNFAQSPDEYGGAWSYGSMGSCMDNNYELVASDHPVTTFTLDVIVRGDGSLVTSLAANTDPELTQSWEEFQAELSSHGLYLSGQPDNLKTFSRNGVPCSHDAVPFMFDDDRRSVSFGGYGRTVQIERSTDLRNWSPFLVTEVPELGGFRVTDTTLRGQMFYRVVTK